MKFFKMLAAIAVTASMMQVLPAAAEEIDIETTTTAMPYTTATSITTTAPYTTTTAPATTTYQYTTMTTSTTPMYTTTTAPARPTSGKCGDDATWSYDGVDTLTISGTGEIKYYYNMGLDHSESYAQYSYNIKNIIISDGITIIGANTFSNFSNLTSVSIADSVVCIGSNAFRSCNSLTSVDFSKNLVNIESYAFSNCSALESVTLPDGLLNIDYNAFSGCTALESVTLPDSLIYVSNSAFTDTAVWNNQTDAVKYVGNWVLSCDDKNITSVEIKEGTKGIAASAFYECTRLTSVSIPEGVVCIQSGAFSTCNHLPEISLPDSLRYLGDSFYNCDALKKEEVDGVSYVSDWAIYYNLSKTNGILKYKNGTKGIVGGSLNLPHSSNSNRTKSSTSYTYALTTIDIPESVNAVNYGTFYNRSTLQNVIIRNPNCQLDMSDDYSRTFCNDWYSDSEYYFTGTIYGEEGSTAQAYAEKYNITFKPLSEAPDTTIQESTETPVSSGSKGDINNDGEINAKDAALILVYAAEVGAGNFSGTIEEYVKSH